MRGGWIAFSPQSGAIRSAGRGRARARRRVGRESMEGSVATVAKALDGDVDGERLGDGRRAGDSVDGDVVRAGLGGEVGTGTAAGELHGAGGEREHQETAKPAAAAGQEEREDAGEGGQSERAQAGVAAIGANEVGLGVVAAMR